MNCLLRFTISVLMVAGFAGLAAADTNPKITADNGSLIEVNARVIAINADAKSMELFDSQSGTAIQVRLTQLRKSERSALIRSDVRRVAVSGRAWMVGGRLVIDAHRIQALPLVDAKVDAKDDTSGTDQRSQRD